MRILTNEQMKAADRHAITQVGLPSVVLMENAGRAVAVALERTVGDLEEARILILCGRGNNGGDGLVVARLLAARGADVRVLLLDDPARLSGDAAVQWGIVQALGLDAEPCDAEQWADEAEALDDADVIVDALLGTGLHGALEGLLAQVVEDVNGSSAPVVAVDVPTGLSGDTAEIAGPAIEAALTVTFAAPKICHVFAPSADLCGELVVADIGIPERSLAESGSTLVLTRDELVAELVDDLVSRPRGSHKGTFGHVLVVGGSLGKSGAPALAGLGALTAGCGLVTTAVAAPVVASVAAHAAELMQVALPANETGEVDDAEVDAAALLAPATSVVIGPGLGTGDGAGRLLWALLEEAEVPLVLDADALNLLSDVGMPAPRDRRPLILTPHPGEFARLTGRPEIARQGQHARLAAAVAFAAEHDVVLVLKGFRTLVVAKGRPVHVAATGGPGMATAGAGDVLAGVIAGLLAQGLPPWAAAVAGVHLHGRAGDLAVEELGEMSVRASDVVRHLAGAIRSVSGEAGDET